MVRNTAPQPYANLGPDDWWHPDTLDARPDDAPLAHAHVERFSNDGFVVVTGLWPADLVEAAAARARALHPAERVLADPGRHSRRFSEMPWLQLGDAAPDDPLNHMTIHPRALAAVAQLLGVSQLDLRLSQSHVIAKAGRLIDDPESPDHGAIEGDQDIHVDYGNNTLLVPPRTAPPEAVACLCYCSNVEDAGGATHFARALPGELTNYSAADFNPPNFVAGTANGSANSTTGPRSAENTARLYRSERPVFYKPGTCILYRLDAWHRGTPAALGRLRHTHHHVWRRRDAEWGNWQSLAPRLASMPTRYLEDLSVAQRSVLGFAVPGDACWTAETLDAVGQRYPGMDMTPYRNADGAAERRRQ